MSLKCLNKRQQDRYSSAAQRAQELDRELRSGQLKLKAKSVWDKLFGGGHS
jgi:hypothetical protein